MPSERPPAVDLEKAQVIAHCHAHVPASDVRWYLADLEATRRERDEANGVVEKYRGLVDVQHEAMKRAYAERDDLRAEVARLKAANGHLTQELAMARRRDGDG